MTQGLLLDLRYEGYVGQQEALVARAAKLESAIVPETTDFAQINGLSTEVQERLSRVRPRTLGQAARIPGITPAAISILGIHLRRSGSAG